MILCSCGVQIDPSRAYVPKDVFRRIIVVGSGSLSFLALRSTSLRRDGRLGMLAHRASFSSARLPGSFPWRTVLKWVSKVALRVSHGS